MPWSWQGGAEKPESNSSVPQQEGHTDTTGGKAVADYDPDIDYQPEGSDPQIEAVNKEEEISDAVHGKMRQPQDMTLHQMTIDCNIMKRIERVHWAQEPEIMASWL